jgi:hypothetical protein
MISSDSAGSCQYPYVAANLLSFVDPLGLNALVMKMAIAQRLCKLQKTPSEFVAVR